jgi:indole-3-glycerol phosphate synthase
VELRRALASDAAIVGVNARDLRTFAVDGAAAAALVSAIPAGRVAVYMSGVHGPDDFAAIARGRADAVLVGEHLVRAADPARAVAALVHAERG